MKLKLYGVIERYGPAIGALVCMIAALLVLDRYDGPIVLGNVFDKVLDSVIVFASITIGFTGVLMGILFSVCDREVIKNFFKGRIKKELHDFFRANVIAGMAVVLLSIAMYTRENFDGLLADVLLCIWVLLVAYTFLSTYRIINIMMYVLFSPDDGDETKEPEGKRMSDEEGKKLADMYKRR